MDTLHGQCAESTVLSFLLALDDILLHVQGDMWSHAVDTVAKVFISFISLSSEIYSLNFQLVFSPVLTPQLAFSPTPYIHS